MSSRRMACVVLGAVLLPLVAGIGCGGRIDSSGIDGASTPPAATAIAKKPQKSPPQTSLPEPEEDEEEPGVCPSPIKFAASKYDALLGGSYRTPSPPAASCTAAEIKAFQSNLSKATIFEHTKQGLSETCIACIFTPSTQIAWGPVVILEDGVQGFVNLGACHAFVNESDACGKAVQYDDFCASEACQECSSSQSGSCFGKVQQLGGVCRATHDAIPTACPKLSTSMQQCGTSIVSHVRFFCAPGT